MKLTQKALDAIKEKRLYPHLAIALSVSTQSVYRWVSENGIMLTTATALVVIREETGLEDSEILESEIETVRG